MTTHNDAATYLDRCRVDEQMLGHGRFKNEVSAQVPYPKQPEHSPWAGDAVPKEPPLGFEINNMGTGNE